MYIAGEGLKRAQHLTPCCRLFVKELFGLSKDPLLYVAGSLESSSKLLSDDTTEPL
jgi:hypothetical protein